MNTNIKELKLTEMEKVIGSGAVNVAARRKFRKKIAKWIESWFD